MGGRKWVQVVVAGRVWKFLKSNALDRRNEYYQKCSEKGEPFPSIRRWSPTRYHVEIDFYPSCYDLTSKAVKRVEEIAKNYSLKSSKLHPRSEFYLSVGPILVAFDVAKELLRKAVDDVSKVALDPHNWELNYDCNLWKRALLDIIKDMQAKSEDTYLMKRDVIKKAKEKLGLTRPRAEILLSHLKREGKIGEVGNRLYVAEWGLLEYLEKKGLHDYIDLFNFMRERLNLDIPEDVKLLNWLEVPVRYKIRPTVRAIADVQSNIVAFFHLNPSDFVHELLHIAGGDEIEAYDITPIILFLWENKDDPRLPEKIKIRDILKIPKAELEKIAQKHGFKSIKEYFQITGVLPYIYDANFELMEGYTEEDEAFVFIMEVSADLRNPINREILFDVVKLLAGEGEE